MNRLNGRLREVIEGGESQPEGGESDETSETFAGSGNASRRKNLDAFITQLLTLFFGPRAVQTIALDDKLPEGSDRGKLMLTAEVLVALGLLGSDGFMLYRLPDYGPLFHSIAADNNGASSTRSGTGSKKRRRPDSHRASCHRCANVRKMVLQCIACPHIYCRVCADMMQREHGPDIFVGGCPKCKGLVRARVAWRGVARDVRDC